MHSRNAALAALIVMVLATAGRAEEDGKSFAWPDNRAGEIARAFFAAFNADDVGGFQTFLEKYQAPDPDETRTVQERAEKMLDLRGQIGVLVPHRIVRVDETTIHVLVKPEKVPMWLNCSLELEGEAPRKLGSFRMVPASGSSDDVDGQWSERSFETLDELLVRARRATNAPAIAMVVMQNGQIVAEAVAGRRAIGSGESATLEDRFHIGSITKSMTATVIGRLVELEQMRWDMTVGEVLPDVEMKDVYRDVTVEQLLQHRGGIIAMTSISAEEAERLDAIEGKPQEVRAKFIEQLLQEAPVGDPGGQSRYSNAGYTLAAAMAERVTGQPWELLVEVFVFHPLEFKTAGFGWPANPTRLDQPRGHSFDGERYETLPFGQYALGPYTDPAGDVHCSVRELARYGHAHLEGLQGKDGLLQSETIKRLHTPQHPELDRQPYAGGWIIRNAGADDEIHWHNGSAGTFFAQVEIEPNTGRVIAVVTNIGIAGQDMTNRLMEAARR